MQHGLRNKALQIVAEVLVEKILMLAVEVEVEEVVVMDLVENFLVTRKETHVISAELVREKMMSTNIVVHLVM